MENRMCSLIEHIERDIRAREAAKTQPPTEAVFSCPPTKERPPRIAGWEWQKQRPEAIAVYNGAYSPSGRRLGHFDKPWTVIGHTVFETFHTHGEAVAFAFREVRG